MQDKFFDRIIRDRLKDVGAGHQPSGWAYLKQRLDAESASGPEPSALDEVFDDVVRQKLVPATGALLVPDWDAMQERLDQVETGVPEPGEQAIDEIVFGKLRDYRSPYKREHWWRMALRLDREFVNADSVWRSKLVELGLMSLLLFTFWQHFPINTGTSPGQWEMPSFMPDAATASDAPSATDRALEGFQVTDDAADPSGSLAAEDAQLEKQAPGVLAESGADASGFAADSGPSSFDSRRKIHYTPFAALPSLEESLSLHARSNDPLRANLLQRQLALHAYLNESAPLLVSYYPGPALSQNPFRKEDPGKIQPVRQKPVIHFGMYGSADYNRIYSPSIRLLDTRLKAFDRYELGYSGGITLGFDLGHWEIQSGAIYSSKQYQPLLAEFWEGEFEDGYAKVLLKDIQLNVVQIPVMFRYNLLHYDSWRFYMMAGASVHVAVSANYFYDNIGAGPEDVAEPNRGWFDGGSFRENSYLTGNVGFGLERYVTPSWSLFAQPTYQHALDFFNHGMGPTGDRISTMSIYTGIRVRIER